jgi:hypothetical protein
MRSERIWLSAVTELRAYPYIRLTNDQNPHLSRAQMTSEQLGRWRLRLRHLLLAQGRSGDSGSMVSNLLWRSNERWWL